MLDREYIMRARLPLAFILLDKETGALKAFMLRTNEDRNHFLQTHRLKGDKIAKMISTVGPG